VDGTLIEAGASHKSFRPKDGSGDADGGANFHGHQLLHQLAFRPDCELFCSDSGQPKA
jgi:hypothetical protein